jgi:hypothetical protein
MTIFSCKGCVPPKRFPGCHGSCPDYIREKAEYNARKAEADKKKATQDGLTEQSLRGVARSAKYRKHMKGK